MRGLSAAIKAEAARLGFQLAGFTTPDPPPHFPFYVDWIERGYHGGMAYLARDRSVLRRADPRAILPECRSILVLGMAYNPNSPAPAGDGRDRSGRVASYAWGVDYHDLIGKRLKELAGRIEAMLGWSFPHRWYTDTGPVMERDLAQRAGLGWIGKNTCLIHPRLGSYFFLAEILLGIDVEADGPFKSDHCGSCTRCIDSCPTGCILPDRTLDAARCISYLTIENRADIPAGLRASIGDWVFGCDVCQVVCPWNERFARPADEAAFSVRAGGASVDLARDLALTPEGFKRVFKGRPIRRAKRSGHLRNVAVALGNSRDPEAIVPLKRALETDPEPLVRSHAAWALGAIGGERAAAALAAAAAQESDPAVLLELERAKKASTVAGQEKDA